MWHGRFRADPVGFTGATSAGSGTAVGTAQTLDASWRVGVRRRLPTLLRLGLFLTGSLHERFALAQSDDLRLESVDDGSVDGSGE